MEEKKFKSTTTYVSSQNDLPIIDSLCVKCSIGLLKNSKEEWGGGLYCPDCKWKWKVSKFTNTNKGFEKVDFGGTEKIKEYIENMGLLLEKRLKKIEEILEVMTNIEE